jgi:hypothetical protein
MIYLSKIYLRFALKPEPRINLKVLLRNAFKFILMVLLIGNGCNVHQPMQDLVPSDRDRALGAFLQ